MACTYAPAVTFDKVRYNTLDGGEWIRMDQKPATARALDPDPAAEVLLARRDWPDGCARVVAGVEHARHEWYGSSGLRRDCWGLPIDIPAGAVAF